MGHLKKSAIFFSAAADPQRERLNPREGRSNGAAHMLRRGTAPANYTMDPAFHGKGEIEIDR